MILPFTVIKIIMFHNLAFNNFCLLHKKKEKKKKSYQNTKDEIKKNVIRQLMTIPKDDFTDIYDKEWMLEEMFEGSKREYFKRGWDQAFSNLLLDAPPKPNLISTHA